MHIENATPFRALALPGFDKDGREVVTVIVKGAFRMTGRGPVEPLAPADQVDVVLADEYHGEPGSSPVSYESDLALFKPATDLILLGSAHAPDGRPTTEVDVRCAVGKYLKKCTVRADRGADRIPLHSLAEAPGAKHWWSFGPSEPEGFGFFPRHLPPRATYAGTYDEAWKEERAPFLPADFDYRFFQAAYPGLVCDGHLRGHEPFRVDNASPGGRIEGELPGVGVEVLGFWGASPVLGEPKLDTVVLEPEEARLLLVWRWMAPTHVPPASVKGFRVRETRAG